MEMARFFDTPDKFYTKGNSYAMNNPKPLAKYIYLAMDLYLFNPKS